jgi:uncharacterized sodium:solute symporter family permease YidK
MEPVAMVHLAGLLLVATFCWCWRQRCSRKTLLARMQEDRKTLLALAREWKKHPG